MVSPSVQLNLRRPSNTRQLVRGILGKVDCTKCGECCRAKQSIVVPGWDDHLVQIRRHFRDRNLPPDKLADQAREGFNLLPREDGSCVFLEGNAQCGIYPDRPSICRYYPFLPLPFQYGTDQYDAFALTTQCPPVAEMNKAGIEYVILSDIADVTMENGKMVGVRSDLNLLGPAITHLWDLTHRNLFPPSIEFLMHAEHCQVFFVLW